jgi:ubiquinone/menaquinone biosynthesis C-methylase UbiE
MADADHMRRYWDERARENANYFVDNRLDYVDGDEDFFWEQGKADVAKLFELLEMTPGPDDVVLDIGCGVGRLLRALEPQTGGLIGIDVSSEMIALATKNLEDIDVTLHVGSGTGLQPVEDSSVDGIISLVVFQHIPDPQITLGYIRDMGRVLKPGGWAAFQVSNDPAIHTADYGKVSKLKQLLGRAPKGQDDAAWRGSAVTMDELGAAAQEGGLEIEKIVGDGTQYCLVRLRRS